MNLAGKAQHDAIVRSASAWRVTLEGDAATEDERERFADWLLQSPLHAQEFLMAEYVWCLLGEALNGEDGPGTRDDAGSKAVPLRLVETRLSAGAGVRDERRCP